MQKVYILSKYTANDNGCWIISDTVNIGVYRNFNDAITAMNNNVNELTGYLIVARRTDWIELQNDSKQIIFAVDEYELI